MSREYKTFSAVLLLAFAASGYPEGAEARSIKCWKNDEGVKECGYVIPPEYAQRRHQEITERGIVKEHERAKTREELEAEAAEAERKAAEEAERKRLAAEQAARDKVLLATFTSEDEIDLARKGKLAAIDTRIQHTRGRIKKMEDNLKKMRNKAIGLEKRGKPVPEKLAKSMGSAERQIEDSRAFIVEREKEKDEVNAKFDADLARYRELKGIEPQ